MVVKKVITENLSGREKEKNLIRRTKHATVIYSLIQVNEAQLGKCSRKIE